MQRSFPPFETLRGIAVDEQGRVSCHSGYVNLWHERNRTCFMPSIKNIPGPYRFFFYSFDCNEPMHVHVRRERMVCKFWLGPVALAANNGFSARELNVIRAFIQSNLTKIQEAWHEHCDEH